MATMRAVVLAKNRYPRQRLVILRHPIESNAKLATETLLSVINFNARKSTVKENRHYR